MARVLVTGGCGFIGGHLVGRLAQSGHEVVVLDASARPLEADPGVDYVQGDVRDEALLGEVAKGVDAIYHLSAMVGVDRYLTSPADVVEVNLLGTLNVLRLAVENGAKAVIASTSEVYGKNPNAPWAEDSDRVLGSTAVDRWSYSTSKALAEHAVYAYIRQHGLRAAIVRYFNVYGPGQRPAYVVSRSVHRALRGLAPEVYDNGTQTRCFTYIKDAIEGTILVGESPNADGECFNIGSHQETTVAEVVKIIGELTGLRTTTPLDTSAAFGARYEDITRRVPDTRKARDMLGWTTKTSLREGLADTIAWARSNPWWLEQLPDEQPATVRE